MESMSGGTRLSPVDEADLSWWLSGEADGDMGLCSNFPAVQAQLEIGGRTGGRPIMEFSSRAENAADRELKLMAVFHAIPLADQRTLRRAYSPQRGHVVLQRFGPLAGLLPWSPTVRREYAARKATLDPQAALPDVSPADVPPAKRKGKAKAARRANRRPDSLGAWLSVRLTRLAQGQAAGWERNLLAAANREAEEALGRAVAAFNRAKRGRMDAARRQREMARDEEHYRMNPGMREREARSQ